VGGYGATGKAVASELMKSGDSEILIGGRDAAKLKSVAADLGSRVSAAPLDVLNARSLDEFCARCSTIVNCGGPVTLLQDRVAQAALRGHCHYVDPAGMSVVKEPMLTRVREIVDLGLSFVVSAGWTPGLTELLPAHAHAQAKAKMDSIESVNVYFSDSGEWSDNALLDGVRYLRQTGLPKPGYFRKGEWVRAKMSEASRKVDLGDPVGFRRFSMFSMPELSELGRSFTDCDLFTYSYLSGVRNAMAATAIAVLPLPENLGVGMLRQTFRRSRLAVGGFVVVHVLGRSEGRAAALKAQVVFESGRDYWINAVALATTARMASARTGVRAGVHFVADAVDPLAFMAELRSAGVQHTETLESREQ
jgi:saccharopine dehydrogenase-like protein